MDIPLWEIEGTMAKAERDAIIDALHHCDYRPAAAAARLRIGRSTIYRLLGTYEIDLPDREMERDAPTQPASELDTPRAARRRTRSAPSNPAVAQSRIVVRNGEWLLVHG